MYSYSHQEIRLAFGTWRTQILAALKVVHITRLALGAVTTPLVASALCRAGQHRCRVRLRSRRRSRERPVRPDHCSLLPTYVLCLATARLANRRVAPGPPAVLCPRLARRHYGRVATGSRIRVASGYVGTTTGLPWLLARWSTACFAISSTSRCGVRGLVLPAGEPCRVSSFAAVAVRTAVGSTP